MREGKQCISNPNLHPAPHHPAPYHPASAETAAKQPNIHIYIIIYGRSLWCTIKNIYKLDRPVATLAQAASSLLPCFLFVVLPSRRIVTGHAEKLVMADDVRIMERDIKPFGVRSCR